MTDTTYYAERFKAWQGKIVGSKPTQAMLAQIHALGFKPGKQALGTAMMLRPEGATAHQIKVACNSGMCRNKVNGIATNPTGLPKNPKGLIAWAEAPLVAGHRAYRIELTASAPKPEVKPVKAKAAKKAKAKLALPAPAETPLAPTNPQA